MKNLNFFKVFGTAFFIQFLITNAVTWFLYSSKVFSDTKNLPPYIIFSVAIILISFIFALTLKTPATRYKFYFLVILIALLFAYMLNINRYGYGDEFISLSIINVLGTLFILLSVMRPTIGMVFGFIGVVLTTIGGVALAEGELFLVLYVLAVLIPYYLVVLFVGRRIHRKSLSI